MHLQKQEISLKTALFSSFTSKKVRNCRIDIFWMRSIFGQLALNLTPKLIEAQFSDYLTDFCAVAQPCENGGSCFDAPGLDPPYGQFIIA